MSEPEEPEQPRSGWWGPPEDEVPSLLAATEILAATEHVAIALIGAYVYREGVELRIERRLRRNGAASKEWSELSAIFMEYSPGGGFTAQDGRLRFGVELHGGERVLDYAPHLAGGDPTTKPEHHTLTRRGGGGGGGGQFYSTSDGLWLWPTPPTGPIEIVVQWPAVGINESRTVIDGSNLAELAARAKPIWS